MAIAQELWPPHSLDDLQIGLWIAWSPYSTCIGDVENCHVYLDSSVSPLLEGNTAFTIFYESQFPPKKANNALAPFLPEHLQWLGNVLVEVFTLTHPFRAESNRTAWSPIGVLGLRSD